jgi:hypothetical protein
MNKETKEEIESELFQDDIVEGKPFQSTDPRRGKFSKLWGKKDSSHYTTEPQSADPSGHTTGSSDPSKKTTEPEDI